MKPRLKILLIEDDEDDRFLTERTLAKAGLTHVDHAPDGRRAVDYLSRDEIRTGAEPLPDAVLVDLKMPGMDGHQVLEWIQTRDELKGVPAFVLSSSGEGRDRVRAAAANVRDYFVKPLTIENVKVMFDRLGISE